MDIEPYIVHPKATVNPNFMNDLYGGERQPRIDEPMVGIAELGLQQLSVGGSKLIQFDGPSQGQSHSTFSPSTGVRFMPMILEILDAITGQ